MLDTLNKAEVNKPEINIEELFARVIPIVGDHLMQKRVALVGDFQDTTEMLLEYLVSCGLAKFSYIPSFSSENNSTLSFYNALALISKRLGLKIEGQILEGKYNLSDFDLIISTGGYKDFELTKKLVKDSGKEGIFYFVMTNGSGLVVFLSPNELVDLPEDIFLVSLEVNLFNQIHLINIVANYAKGLLLKGTEHAHLDIESVVNSSNILIVGHSSWPWVVKPIGVNALLAFAKDIKEESTLSMKGKNCLVVGLGSLGSVVAKTLSQLGANLILVDGENVDLANPIRQIYSVDQIGESKAQACADKLKENAKDQAQQFWAYKFSIDTDKSILELENLLIAHNIDVAVVATGTGNDRIISQTLVSKKVPHVVVSCYARARFFEAIVVRPDAPCFGCVRGHLYLGKTPSLTPEQRARYVSSDYDLAAEPATRVETGRAADLASHIAYSLLNLEKVEWLARALRSEQTFFLGGNTSEKQEDKWVYTIETPGEVKLFGLEDIFGRGDYIECWDCGKKIPITIHYQTTVK